MEENSNTTKSFRQKCEEEIKYIQSHLISYFKFDLLPFEISPDEQRSYYSQLHGLLFAYISTYKLDVLEQKLMFYIDNKVQQPEDTIRCIVKYCQLKTLGIEEQFAVFRLLSKDNIRTLLELSMEDCDTFTYQTLLGLSGCDDLEKFKEQAGSINYSASKISRMAQAICIHSRSVSAYFYNRTLKSILDRIASYNEDFASHKSLTIPDYYYYSFEHIRGTVSMLLSKKYIAEISDINSHVLDYGAIRADKHSRTPSPSTIKEFLPQLMKVRIKMLEQYISDKVDELKDKRQEERPLVTTPASYTAKPASLTAIPTNITKVAEINAFCKAFASYCDPNDLNVVMSFFWKKQLDKYPKKIVWKAKKKLFAAFLHYAFKDHDLPKDTEILVKDIFVWRDKPLDIAGYGKAKYEGCYDQIRTQIDLSLKGLMD